MKKDFMTITPDSGGGSQEVTVAVPANTGNARSSTITIQGGGITRTINVNQEATKVLELLVYFELENNCPDYIPNSGNEVDVVRLRLSADLQAENSTIGVYPGSSETYEELISNVDSSTSYQAIVIFNSSQGASAGLTIIGEVTDNEGTVLLPSQSLSYSDSGAQRDFSSNYFTLERGR